MFFIRKKFSSTKSGFTLIELIATMGILSIVLSLAYSMGNFGSNYFHKEDTKSDIQSNLRIASTYINNELRYSSKVQILGASHLPDFTKAVGDVGGPVAGTKYIYVDLNGKLKIFNGTTKSLIKSLPGDYTSKLTFDQKDSETASYSIDIASKGFSYSFASSVIIQNLGYNLVDKLDPNGVAIAYSPGVPMTLDISYTKVTAITISSASNTLVAGSNMQLTADITPADASIKDVTWSVDNPSIASISIDGILHGLVAGTVKVIATTDDESSVAADGSAIKSNPYTIQVTTAPVDAPQISHPLPPNQYLLVGETFKIENMKYYFNGNNLSFSAVSNNTNITDVNINSTDLIINPKNPGSTTITVTATNANGSVSQTFTVHTYDIIFSKNGNVSDVLPYGTNYTYTINNKDKTVTIKIKYTGELNDVLLTKKYK